MIKGAFEKAEFRGTKIPGPICDNKIKHFFLTFKSSFINPNTYLPFGMVECGYIF